MGQLVNNISLANGYTIYSDDEADNIKVCYKRSDNIDEDITEDVLNECTKELLKEYLKTHKQLIEIYENIDNPEYINNLKVAKFQYIPNLGDSIGKWQISSDGYYPYCPDCFYEPYDYIKLIGKLPAICLNCGRNMGVDKNDI